MGNLADHPGASPWNDPVASSAPVQKQRNPLTARKGVVFGLLALFLVISVSLGVSFRRAQPRPSFGRLKWSFTADGPTRYVISDIQIPPLVVNGLLYVGSQFGEFSALDAASGRRKWSLQAKGDVFSSPVVANGILYLSSRGDKVYALDAASGRVQWSTTAGGSPDPFLTVVNGLAYVSFSNGKLSTLDAHSGTLKWSFSAQGEIDSSPTVVNGSVYIDALACVSGSDKGGLYALDAHSGRTQWSYPLAGDYPPIVLKSTIYVAGSSFVAAIEPPS